MKSTVLRIVIWVFVLVCVNIISSRFFVQWDLTSDQRFTLTEQSEKLLQGVDDVIFIQIFLDGEEFPAGFRRLRREVAQLMRQFHKLNPNIEYRFSDPLDGTPEQQASIIQEMMADGMPPVRLMVSDGASSKEQRIFPYAMISYGSRKAHVNLLESQAPGQPQEVILNNSAALLEYKFANSIQHLLAYSKPNVLFLQGHGELTKQQSAALEQELRRFYNTAHASLDSLVAISPEIDVLLVADPRGAFSERDKFLIDQYLMNGGNIMWLVDALDVNLDSIAKYPNYIPQQRDLGLDYLWSRQGFRPNADLILDLECTRIPLQVGQVGGQPDMQLFPWFYHPLVHGMPDHPISSQLDRINLKFAGTVDTLKTKGTLRKTALMQTSPYTRIQRYPMRLSFDMAHKQPDASKFDQGMQTTAWLIEGEFVSAYENRVPADLQETMKKLGNEFKSRSSDAKVLVITDGDISKSLYNSRTREFTAMGFNKWENFVFGGNRDFIINAIDYMVDERGIMESRKKEMKLRLLDPVKSNEEKLKWQLINILLPLSLFLLLSWGFHVYRRRKYTVR